MPSKKIIQILGLALFVAGFLLFNASFFLSHYRLTAEQADAAIADSVRSAVWRSNAKELLHTTYHSKFPFINQLKGSLQKTNERLLKAYGLTEAELTRLADLIMQNNGTFSKSLLDEGLSDNSEKTTFKRQAFSDYGSWLEGRTFESQAEVKKQLSLVNENIKNYAIISRFGFDQYAQSDLVFTLTRKAVQGPVIRQPGLFLFLTYGMCIIGALLYLLPRMKELAGIKNNGIFFDPLKNVGWLGILVGSYFIAFYIFLYFYPAYMVEWIAMVDPVSEWLKNEPAGRFFLYGFIYTLAILVMGIRMLLKYRHSKYHIIRTLSVMFFQTAFAFLIPEILLRLNQPYFDFKNIWPLDYDFFFESQLNELISSGTLGIFMLGWGIALILLGVPLMTYFLGKRWYCSWVCGCGGLAETLGDPYRQLSDKSLKAWQIERWMVHGVLVFAVVMTGAVLYTYFTEKSTIAGINSYNIRSIYGAWIGAGFAGVIGTGFYPFMGNRVWCRFGCPLAAYLGIVQRFKSRFRITTNGGQCISCGNCSTYCEMGIDVRWYAQRGQNIIRASCVGCGVCASVCPRGVLKLENKDEKGRFGKPILIGNNSATIAN